MRVCFVSDVHRGLSEEKQELFLQRCMANVERLQRLLADVSLITRMDDGCPSIVKEPVDLSQIIAAVVEERQIIAAARGVTIENDVRVALPMTGNPALLEAVFNNLLDNAVAYSGGTVVRIALIHHDDEKIVLSVSDNGTGVPDVHLPNTRVCAKWQSASRWQRNNRQPQPTWSAEESKPPLPCHHVYV